MANPKLLRPLPKSIIHTKKQAIVHYNRQSLENQNHKAALILQENKSNHMLSLEEVMINDITNNGPFKASVHTEEDSITREAAVKSAQIIINLQVLVKFLMMMFVFIFDRLLSELQRRIQDRGMERVG